MVNKQSIAFIAYFVRRYPARTLIIVLLLIFSGVAEGIGIVAMLPLLQLADPSAASDSGLAQAIGDILVSIGLEPTTALLLALIVLVMSLKAGFLWLATRQVGYTVAHVASDLRLRVISALLKARWAYFTSQSTGHLANAISSEAHRTSGAYKNAVNVLVGMIQVLIYLGVAILVSWQVAVLGSFAGLAITGVLAGFVKMSRRAGARQTELMKALIGRFTDALHSIKPIKAMAREEELSRLLVQNTQDINRAQMRHVLASGTLKNFQEPLLVLALATVVYAALTVGDQPFSSLLVTVFIFYRLVGRVNLLQTQYQSMVEGESAFWSLVRLATDAEKAQESTIGAIRPLPLRTAIQFESVCFSYGEKHVLNHVTFDIPAGKFIALIGPSGAGKTTIADLLVGLHLPQSGEIRVDGITIVDLDITAWRHMIGYVPQEMLLLHDSVYHNVTLGSREIDRSQVADALTAAGAWEFVSDLPEGIDTVIGESGAKLSGGQRQRLAIARALVRKPTLLILDEVTTALDPKNEIAICDTLRRLCGQTTVVAISHQPTIIGSADIVYRIQDGVVSRELHDPPQYHGDQSTTTVAELRRHP